MKAPDSYYSQDDLKKAAAATEKILKGETVVIEMSLITKDGKSIPTEYAGSVIKDDEGNPRYIIALGRNITERKQAEEALREMNSRYRLLIEASVSGINLLDKEGNFLITNEPAGMPWGKRPEDMINKNIKDVFPSEFADGALNIIRKVRETGTGLEQERFIEHLNKHYIENIQPIFDDKKEFFGVQVITIDITERKRAEEALRDREEKWRSLAETAPVVIMNVSRDGTIKFINSVLEQHTLEQVIGTRVYDYIPQDQHDRVRKFLERAFETGKPDSLEILAVGPEGPETAWYENHIGPILDQNGKVVNVTMVAIDITERKRAEKELREKSAFRKAVIERAAEGICVCHAIEEHPHIEFTVWNERMEDITGYTMDEINRLDWYQTMYPDPQLQQKAIERMERMRQGDDLVAEEWEITRKDGLKRLLAISTSVIVTEGNKSHVLALMHDITEEKKAQKEHEDFLKGLIDQNK